MKDYSELAKFIIENVGGKDNISSVSHCITRLRFKLKDEGKANTDALSDKEGIVKVMQSGGQYQVVIGNEVADVYKEVSKIGGFTEDHKVEDDNSKGPFAKLIDIISGVIAPTLGVLAATGLLKGLLTLAVFFKLLSDTSGTYLILYSIADSVFYFLPAFLGYLSFKKFGGNPLIGLTIGLVFCYPNIVGMDPSKLAKSTPLLTLFKGTFFESNVYHKFLGIPVIMMNYTSSVVPIIVTSYFGAKLENFFQKTIPAVLKMFLVPLLTLIIIVPLTFLVIGPVTTWLAQLIGAAIGFVYNLSPIIAGILIGGLWQVLVIFGLHWSIIPIALYNLTAQGFDQFMSPYFAGTFAQIAVVLAIVLKTKDKKLKQLGVLAFVTGIFGITEPAIYGITLPKKKPFIISCIGAAIGGGIIGFFRVTSYTFGAIGIFGFTTYINTTTGDMISLVHAAIGVVVAMVVSFVLTFITYKDDEEVKADGKDGVLKKDNNLVEDIKLYSPLNGEVIAIENVEDEAFSSKALGNGVAVIPTEGKLYAPCDGTIATLFPTGHALGILSDDGAEILIHIGMDTVQLEGKYFTIKTKNEKYVKKGELLIEFDIEKIKEAGYDITTPIVITNSTDYLDVVQMKDRYVKHGEEIIKIIR